MRFKPFNLASHTQQSCFFLNRIQRVYLETFAQAFTPRGGDSSVRPQLMGQMSPGRNWKSEYSRLREAQNQERVRNIPAPFSVWVECKVDVSKEKDTGII